MISNKEHNVDFGIQNVAWIIEHYSQPGKEGPQKINTVGILYHPKWHNILQCPGLWKCLWINMEYFCLWLLTRTSHRCSSVMMEAWKLCLQWVNLKFSRRFTNTVGIPLTCIQTRYKGSNMLGTSHSLLGIGSNHYVIREYNAAVSKHLFLVMNF